MYVLDLYFWEMCHYMIILFLNMRSRAKYNICYVWKYGTIDHTLDCFLTYSCLLMILTLVYFLCCRIWQNHILDHKLSPTPIPHLQIQTRTNIFISSDTHTTRLLRCLKHKPIFIPRHLRLKGCICHLCGRDNPLIWKDNFTDRYRWFIFSKHQCPHSVKRRTCHIVTWAGLMTLSLFVYL